MLAGDWRPVDVVVGDLDAGAGLPHLVADSVGDSGCPVPAVPAVHQELDRATVDSGAQRGEFVHGVGDDEGRAWGVEDVVAYARVLSGLAGDDVGEGRVVGRVEQLVGQVDAEDGGAVAGRGSVLPVSAERVDEHVRGRHGVSGLVRRPRRCGPPTRAAALRVRAGQRVAGAARSWWCSAAAELGVSSTGHWCQHAGEGQACTRCPVSGW